MSRGLLVLVVSGAQRWAKILANNTCGGEEKLVGGKFLKLISSTLAPGCTAPFLP